MTTSSPPTDNGASLATNASSGAPPSTRPNSANPQQGAQLLPAFFPQPNGMETPPRRVFKVPPHKKDTRKLFVGGLPANITEQEFQEFFQQFGTLIDSVVMFDRDTRRSRGFGFVTFEDPEVCRRLLLMGNEGADPNDAQNLIGRLEMQGKFCEIKAATPKEGRSRRNDFRVHHAVPPLHRPQFDSPPHPNPGPHPYGMQYGYPVPPHGAVPGHHFFPPGGYIPPNFGMYPADYAQHPPPPTPPVEMSPGMAPPPVGINTSIPGGMMPHFPHHMIPPEHMMTPMGGVVGGLQQPAAALFGGAGSSVMHHAPVGNHHYHEEEIKQSNGTNGGEMNCSGS